MALFNGRNNYNGTFPQNPYYTPPADSYRYGGGNSFGGTGNMQPQQGSGYQYPGVMYYVQAVSSMKEAEACSIPMDGSIVIFPNFANNEIYTKQINMSTGEGIFKEYSLKSKPVQENTENKQGGEKPQFATMEQLNIVSNEVIALKNFVSQHAGQLQEIISQLQKPVAEEKPKTTTKSKEA